MTVINRNLILFFIFISGWVTAQVSPNSEVVKTLAVSDSLIVNSVSIDSNYPIILKSKSGETIDSNLYIIDYQNALLTFIKKPDLDSIVLIYNKFPDFITKTYKVLDDNMIVKNSGNLDRLYTLKEERLQIDIKPFDGLSSSGSLSRGLTIGNNQNGVLNSNLDLNISGKLSEKVTLRASIQDANIPIQDGGYSKRVDDFDQIFIEFESVNWRLKGGDIDLTNSQSEFNSFTKRIQGISFDSRWHSERSEIQAFGSAAIARGQFARSQFTATEGNQGPYKLKGAEGELYVLIVSGSESIYVNGLPLERGQDRDYTIDYNAGEITFTATFPITSDMRITADYQFSDRNYTRFVTFNGAAVKQKKFSLEASIYAESDLKNQSLQQNLSESQEQFLTEAGDGELLASSAQAATYDANRILYRKIEVDGIEVFEYSSDPEEDLFSLKFTEVGPNEGNYQILSTDAIAYIYEYVSPIDGVPQGNFEPVTNLAAPKSLKLANVIGSFQISAKTKVDFDLAGSQYDQNLFSSINDDDNNGYAGFMKLSHHFSEADHRWQWNFESSIRKVNKSFRSIEALYQVEFDRDWDLGDIKGTQEYLRNRLTVKKDSSAVIQYEFEHLNFGDDYSGQKHNIYGILRGKRIRSKTISSVLNTNGENQTTFLRVNQKTEYSGEKSWSGLIINVEDLQKTNKFSNIISPISNRFLQLDGYIGIGDSLAIHGKLGYRYRENDSVYDGILQKANKAKTFYLNTSIIDNQQAALSVFLNYREQTPYAQLSQVESSINARVQYRQNLFKRLVLLQTLAETSAGQLPQQGFTFVEVEPGQGTYTWNDYNDNGIQELEEFELANFQDQGIYVRLFLPHQVFVKIQEQIWRQTIKINPKAMGNGQKNSIWHKLYNETSFALERKAKRSVKDFDFELFDWESDKVIGLNVQFRNGLQYNRDEKTYNTSYFYVKNRIQNLWSTGLIKNDVERHQLRLVHQLHPNWTVNFSGELENQKRKSETYQSRNFDLFKKSFSPNLIYAFGSQSQIEFIYKWTQTQNKINAKEYLKQQQLALTLSSVMKSSSTLNAELRYINNSYFGQNNTPVAYQLLEGLQAGENWTWSLVGQQKLTKSLDLNISYFGRKSTNLRMIHTGSLQLRANF